MSTSFHALTVKKINKETADTVTITLEVPPILTGEFQYIAGQYLTFKKTVNGEEIRRSYSICSAPYEKELSVAVKAIENGLFSQFAVNELKVGDTLDTMPPMGNFKITPDANAQKNHIFYAAGSGITPVISMVKTILKEEPKSKVHMFYGNKSAADTIFLEELDALDAANDNFELVHFLSREDTGNPITNGRIDQSTCASIFNTYLHGADVDAVYACGPEQMIMCVKDFYTNKGMDKSKIHFELFKTSVPTENIAVESGEVISSNVTVVIDDEEYQFDLNSNGKNILQAAQDQDADVPFSCKGGVCCTCRAKVMEGTVRMDLNFALEEDEVADGFILTCQAHPTSEKVVISFDEY
ncbi:2Fe-2S iron-sulfur cluster-binding protein [Crocinitomix catalasitica]|uniref:2Fe-2S iron-sulfur cluster-binding protein n=1 Tax=Crocinitomix catalasitica TaxID=184607 RepID=UPI000482A5D1|nr:2Fe-2S iron-sulfur cluster-binding protein [Crocinitomix catalasitica]